MKDENIWVDGRYLKIIEQSANQINIFRGLQQVEENSAKLLIKNILIIFAIAEYAPDVEIAIFPWRNDARLLKRRTAYTFDTDVQCLAKKLRMDNLKTEYLSSGNGYSKTELILHGKIYVHIHNTLNPKAKYLQRYFDMNKIENSDNSYYYFQYRQKNKKRSISDIKLVYKDKELNLMKAYAKIKSEMDIKFKNEYISYLSYLLDSLLILDDSEKGVFEK